MDIKFGNIWIEVIGIIFVIGNVWAIVGFF